MRINSVSGSQNIWQIGPRYRFYGLFFFNVSGYGVEKMASVWLGGILCDLLLAVFLDFLVFGF